MGEPGGSKNGFQEELPCNGGSLWWKPLGTTARLILGVELVRLGAELGGLRPYHAVIQLARLAMRAVSEGDREAAAVLPVDVVAQHFLDAVPFTPEESIEAAKKRREEILNDPNSIIMPGEKIPNPTISDDPGATRLSELEEMLFFIQPLIAKIQDGELRNSVQAWVDRSKNWEIGEEAAAAARRRMAE